MPETGQIDRVFELAREFDIDIDQSFFSLPGSTSDWCSCFKPTLIEVFSKRLSFSFQSTCESVRNSPVSSRSG